MVKNESALVVATVARVVRQSTRHAWIIVPAFLIAAILADVFVSRHIAINTDSSFCRVRFPGANRRSGSTISFRSGPTS